jgi:hypothetical protein
LSRHLFRPVVERLEERWLLAVTFNVDGNALSFSSDAGDELYLKIAAGGDLRYGTDGSNFTSTNFEVTAGSTVSYDQDNAVYLTGMDEGAGNFVMTGEVQVTGDLFTHGGDLTITGTSITVGPDVLISTSPPTGTSAAAGAITLTAARGSVTDGTFITLGANSRLQATGDAGDGVISLTADDTFEFVFNFTLVNQIYDLFNHKFQATIEVEPGAEIVGGDVSLKAESGVANKFTSTPNIGDSVGLGVLNFLTTILDNTVLSLPVSVLISKAYATTEIGENAAIHSSGSVNLSSSATANSTGEATNFLLRNMKVGVFSFAFAKAETSARSLLDENATITAAGDVSIASVTKTTTSATSLESRNPAPGSTADPNAIGLSAAVNELKTTSHAKVAQGAVIQSVQGNVTIAASATNKNTVKVQSNIYRNGIAGLSGAGANVNADVLASVDGTIIAGGRDTGSTVTLDPFAATGSTATPSGTTPVIDFANSRFVFAADPGYSTGEPLVYSSGLGGPIPGLSNNATYFAIASQSGSQFYLQLAATAAEAVATPPTFIAFGQYPTINGIPITNVDASADSAILFDFNPGFTEGQTVTIVPAAGQFLGYDNSDGSLGGPLSGTYTVHIVNDRVDSSQLYAIQLRTADGSTVQLDNRPYLTTAAGKTLRIQSVNTDGDLLVLDPADVPSGFDLANGDALVYHAGLATSITGLSDGATYYAIVDPSQFASVSVNSLLTLQFAATPQAAASANPVTTNPTLTWTDSHGVAQTTTIDSAVPGLSEALIGETYSLSIVSSDLGDQRAHGGLGGRNAAGRGRDDSQRGRIVSVHRSDRQQHDAAVRPVVSGERCSRSVRPERHSIDVAGCRSAADVWNAHSGRGRRAIVHDPDRRHRQRQSADDHARRRRNLHAVDRRRDAELRRRIDRRVSAERTILQGPCGPAGFAVGDPGATDTELFRHAERNAARSSGEHVHDYQQRSEHFAADRLRAGDGQLGERPDADVPRAGDRDGRLSSGGAAVQSRRPYGERPRRIFLAIDFGRVSGRHVGHVARQRAGGNKHEQ